MATLKNTTITGNGQITLPSGTTFQRPQIVTTVIQWTNTGTQSYNVLYGATPTISNTSWTAPTGVNQIEVLVVAGGGAGGANLAGGGGGGGVIYRSDFAVTPGTQYTVTVGAGGVAVSGQQPGATGNNGGNSVFGSLTAIGGGGGGGGTPGTTPGTGGSGGGSTGYSSSSTAGTGTAGQGFPGGTGSAGSPNYPGGGGGGAGGAGTDQRWNSGSAGSGGIGLPFSILGPTYYFGGGGGGATYTSGQAGNGGLGGGGGGGSNTSGRFGKGGTGGLNNGQDGIYGAAISGGAAGLGGQSGGNGGASTGGGGGGGAHQTYVSGAGGSGTVIIKYAVLADGNDPRGLIRYNTELKNIEIYESVTKGWTSQETRQNFAGHNLIRYSEAIASGWTLSSITSSGTIAAPFGIGTAIGIAETATTAQHLLYQNVPTATVVGDLYTFSGYFKNNTNVTQIVLHTNAEGTGVFDIIGGTVVTRTGSCSGAGIESIGNGWYRCYATFTKTTTGTTFYVANQNGLGSYAGNTSTNYYVWGLQVETGVTTPGPYTKTVDARVYPPYRRNGYQVHRYTDTGTASFVPAVSGTVEVMVVAGGGGGGAWVGAGGGAGGLLYSSSCPVISGQSYEVTVGVGGTREYNPGGYSGMPRATNGGDSVFGPLRAIGGGRGGSWSDYPGTSGGSGGGNGYNQLRPAGIAGQGNAGGLGRADSTNGYPTGGGGGAGGQGGDWSTGQAGNGGPGLPYSLSGQPLYYAGGGGGGCHGNATASNVPAGTGGIGGGGDGDRPSSDAGTANPNNTSVRLSNSTYPTGEDGEANTGGGGGGSGSGGGQQSAGGAGGSGIVIVRYKSI